MHATPLPSRQKPTVSARIRRALCALTWLVATGSVPSAHAASGTWIGTSSLLWSVPSNWSSLTAPPTSPGSGDIATFSNPGNGNDATSIFLVSPPITIGSIIFNTASVASHNIGDGMDTLILNAAGTITMNDTVARPQNIGANLILGTASGADAFIFTNNSVVPGAVLFFSGGMSSGTNTGVKTVTVTGAGITEIGGGIANGAGSVTLIKTGTGTLNFVPRLLPASTLAFNTLNASGGTTNIDAALGAGPGTAAVTLTNTASLRFGSVSQRLSSLTIGAGSTVTFTSGTASCFAGPDAGGKSASLSAAIIPEPGSFGPCSPAHCPSCSAVGAPKKTAPRARPPRAACQGRARLRRVARLEHPADTRDHRRQRHLPAGDGPGRPQRRGGAHRRRRFSK